MTTSAPQKSKRFWWWNSHISPKNSKWLQENLNDMDTKVKQMFKLLEDDADSFARKAEMYYKKRPEMLKLVEEFYKAYRALAERYDNATGALRQAQRTMAEAFPNQVPPTAVDDSPSPSGSDSRTPDAYPLLYVVPDDTPKGSSSSKARKGLVFDDADDNGNHNSEAEMKISALESDFARVEAEKEAAVLKCEQMLEKISALEEECDKSKDFDQKIEEMKSTVTKLENEREIFVVQCQNYESKISELEKSLTLVQNDTANFVVEASSLKDELIKMGAEKDDFVRDHQQLLLSFSEAEAKLLRANDDAKKIEQKFEAASKNFLEEKETMKREIDEIISKKDFAEEKHYLSESLIKSMKSELEAKNQEMKTLLVSLEEEHLRYVEAETAFQTLQQMNSQCQKELLSLSTEMQKQQRNMEDIELQNKQLRNEVSRITSERNSLNEAHLSSMMIIQELKVHNGTLTDAITKLEGEVGLRTDERNALQQEIYWLKEELNEVKEKHLGIVGSIESIGFNPDNFKSGVRSLMEDCERGKSEQDVLMGRISVLEKIAQEKQLLENSFSDLCVEREDMKRRIEMLEESYRSLLEENSFILDQKAQLEAQIIAWKEELESVTKNNSSLERSLLESLSTIESLGTKLKDLGDSCSELEDEKTKLLLAKENMAMKLSELQMQLEILKAETAELVLEKETLMKEVEKLKASYSTEVEEHEYLKVKSRNAEDSFFTLEQEKSKLQSDHHDLIAQISSVGFHPASLASSLKGLLEENVQLKQTCDEGIVERSALNENKASLESQLLACNNKVESAMDEISSLEKALAESLSKNEMLENDKLVLVTTNEKLSSELGTSLMQLETLKGEYEELEKEMDFVLLEVEKLNGCYSSEVKDHEDLKIKSRNLEDSFFLLEKEKSELQSNHKSFVSQVESVGFKTENLASTLGSLLKDNDQLRDDCAKGNVERSALESQLVFVRGELESATGKNGSLEKSLAELRLTTESLETQLRNLEGMCSKLENEKKILKNEKESLQNETQELRASYSAETEEHQSLKVKSKGLEDSFASLELEKSHLHHNYTSFVTQVESVGFKTENLASSLRILLEENSQLKENCERGKIEISSLEKSLIESRSSIESLEMKLKNFEDEKESLTLSKANLITELETLTGEYKELEEHNVALEKEKGSLIYEVEELKACYSTETREHGILKVKSRNLEDSFVSLETEKSELHKTYSSFVTQVESVGFKPENLASSLRELQEENAQLKENCDGRKAEISSLESQILLLKGELEGVSERNGSLEESLAESRSSIESLEKKSTSLEDEKESLALLRANLVGELETLTALYKELEIKKDFLEQERGLLHNEVEELRAEEQAHQNLKVKCRSLEDSFTSLETEKSELHSRHSSFISQVESVGFKPETLVSSVNNLLEENSRLKENCDASHAERSSLESQLLLVKEELESFIKRNGSFERTLFESLEMLEMKLKYLVADCGSLTVSLKKQNECLIKELEDLKACYSLETQQHQNLKLKSKGFEDSLFSLESKKLELHSDYQNFITQVESVGLKPESFSSSVRDLLQENTRLKQNYSNGNVERSALVEEKLALCSASKELLTELEDVKKSANDFQESHRIVVSDLEHQLADKCSEFEIKACILENAIRSLSDGNKEQYCDLMLLQSHLLLVFNAADSSQRSHGDLTRNSALLAQETEALISALKDDYLTAVIQNSVLISFLQEMQILNVFLATSLSDLDEESVADRTFCLVLKSTVIEMFDALKEMAANVKQSESEAQENFKSLQESAILSTFYQGKFIETNGTPRPEETEVSGTVPKDIVLDHVSETSSFGVRRKASEDDDQMLKLWETTNHVSTSNHDTRAHSRGSQSMTSAELSIDKLEISKTFSSTFWDAKRVMERLRSDEAKLSNLRVAVRNMKLKVPKSGEHDAVRVQLEESDVAIAELAERNMSLKRTVEENEAWFEESAPLNSDVAAVKRKRVREETRRGSEKISRLEMELQKMEFILTNKNDKVVRKNTVPLRDYLYGKKRSPLLPAASKRFCACLRI